MNPLHCCSTPFLNHPFSLPSGSTYDLLKHLLHTTPDFLPEALRLPGSDLLTLMYDIAPTLSTPDQAYNFLEASYQLTASLPPARTATNWHVNTRDGLPLVGSLPGLQPGRVLLATTSCGDRLASRTGSAQHGTLQDLLQQQKQL